MTHSGPRPLTTEWFHWSLLVLYYGVSQLDGWHVFVKVFTIAGKRLPNTHWSGWGGLSSNIFTAWSAKTLKQWLKNCEISVYMYIQNPYTSFAFSSTFTPSSLSLSSSIARFHFHPNKNHTALCSFAHFSHIRQMLSLCKRNKTLLPVQGVSPKTPWPVAHVHTLWRFEISHMITTLYTHA